MADPVHAPNGQPEQMHTLRDPTLQLLLYFHRQRAPGEKDEDYKEASPCLDLGLPERFQLQAKSSGGGEQRYLGTLAGGEQLELSWTPAHDTHLLRLRLTRIGNDSPAVWAKMHDSLEEMLENAWQQPSNPQPWAASLLYCAALPERPSSEELEQILSSAELLSSGKSPALDATPFGWLWSLAMSEEPLPGGKRYPMRRSVLLYPHERSEAVQTYFLKPLSQGFARIELYLMKAKHHAHQADRIRINLESARQSLQTSMLEALETADFSQLQREQLELEAISQRLMRFLTQKAAVDLLLNALANNRHAFQDHLQRVRLETPIYKKEEETLARQEQQLESDLRNANVVAENTTVFQDIQRGVEGSRLERASFLMGAAAALLAGIFTFNSFLDIWSLALEGTGLQSPAIWLRILLGLIAGVSLPLAATWVVERRRLPAILAIALALISIIMAVVSTIIVNR